METRCPTNSCPLTGSSVCECLKAFTSDSNRLNVLPKQGYCVWEDSVISWYKEKNVTQLMVFVLSSNSSFVKSKSSALKLETREDFLSSMCRYTARHRREKLPFKGCQSLNLQTKPVLFYQNAKSPDQNISHTTSAFPWVSLSHSIFSQFCLRRVVHLCVISE